MNPPLEGFILKTIDYKDTSKLLYAYTKKGHISMIARGVKKMNSPLRHQAQTHMRLKMDLSSGKLPTLKEAQLIDHFPKIKADFIRSNCLYAISELIYHNVHPDDNHEKLYPFLLKVADTLKTTDTPLEALAIFEMKLLNFEGVGLNLRACDVCGRKEGLILDADSGVLVCETHANKAHHLIGENIAKAIQYFYYVDILTFVPMRLSEQEMRLVFEITDGLYKDHLGFHGKAKAILKSLLTEASS